MWALPRGVERWRKYGQIGEYRRVASPPTNNNPKHSTEISHGSWICMFPPSVKYASANWALSDMVRMVDETLGEQKKSGVGS